MSPERVAVIQSVMKEFETEAFIWGQFPLELPPSSLCKDSFSTKVDTYVRPTHSQEGETSAPILSLEQEFMEPDVQDDAELERVAKGEDGALLKLTPEQLASVREEGIFEVRLILTFLTP